MRRLVSASSALLRMTFTLWFHNIGVTSICQESIYPRFRTVKRVQNMSTDIPGSSIHAAHIEEIHNVPFDVLIRPFPSELDESKVLSLMGTLKNPKTKDDVPPVDVLWITGSEGGNYFYSFGGCHRYEAHKRLGLPTIRCKLVKSTVADLRTYLGGSTPDLK